MRPARSSAPNFATFTELHTLEGLRGVKRTGGAFTREMRALLRASRSPCLEKRFELRKLQRLVRERLAAR